MLKKFYKLYHYIATIFYPDVIEEISTNIAFCFCDKRLNSQNKISKLFWSIVGNICNFFTSYVMSSKAYSTGLEKHFIQKQVNMKIMIIAIHQILLNS